MSLSKPNASAATKTRHRVEPAPISGLCVTCLDGCLGLMAGARKFRLDLIDRNDLMSLTREAAEISGIPYVMDVDRAEVDRILS